MPKENSDQELTETFIKVFESTDILNRKKHYSYKQITEILNLEDADEEYIPNINKLYKGTTLLHNATYGLYFLTEKPLTNKKIKSEILQKVKDQVNLIKLLVEKGSYLSIKNQDGVLASANYDLAIKNITNQEILQAAQENFGPTIALSMAHAPHERPRTYSLKGVTGESTEEMLQKLKAAIKKQKTPLPPLPAKENTYETPVSSRQRNDPNRKETREAQNLDQTSSTEETYDIATYGATSTTNTTQESKIPEPPKTPLPPTPQSQERKKRAGTGRRLPKTPNKIPESPKAPLPPTPDQNRSPS